MLVESVAAGITVIVATDSLFWTPANDIVPSGVVGLDMFILVYSLVFIAVLTLPPHFGFELLE